jgi:hypothetical protein
MKLCDAGPIEQRVEPIHVSLAVRELVQHRHFIRQCSHPAAGSTPWYTPARTSRDETARKLELLAELYRQTTSGGIQNVVGQALELVILETLREMTDALPGSAFFGDIDQTSFTNTGRYRVFKKSEPPSQVSGKTSKKVGDFHVVLPDAGLLLIECKNMREWLYPHSGEIKETIIKAAELQIPPILVTRKLPYITREILCRPAGIITHESYYQYYPSDVAAHCPVDPYSLTSIIERAKQKDLLGYADIRQQAQPRTRKFFLQDLPGIAPEMVKHFKRNIPALLAFAHNEINLEQLRSKLRA